MSSEELLKQAEEQLYTALQALESKDLPYARSSSARAASLITESWQVARRVEQSKAEDENI